MKEKFLGIIKKILYSPVKLLHLIGGFFASVWQKIWDFLCKNDGFRRFAYVTFPIKRDKVLNFIKNNRFSRFVQRNKLKILIPAAVLITALLVIVGTTVQNSENSDYFPAYVPLPQYGMRVFTYQTFDHSDIKHGSVFLNWDDGVLNLAAGETTARIKATVNPINMNDTEIVWSVSDEEYATIDQDGFIEAKKPGRVHIYANLVNYGVTAEAKLLIRQPVTGILLPTSNLTLYKGGSAKYLDVRIFPENATNKVISWTSKNPRVASVDQNGTVRPVSVGMTEITAVAEDGNGEFEAKCFVTVIEPTVEVESLTLVNAEAMTMNEGDSVNAIITVAPVDAKNKMLKWSSDNTSVAQVSQTGRIRGVGGGVANIIAESANGIRLAFGVEVNAAVKEPEHTDNANDNNNGYFNNNIIYPSGGVNYVSYNETLTEAVAIQMRQNPPPKIWTAGGGIDASVEETTELMDPNRYYEDPYKYQFLDLSVPNNVSEDELNNYLSDKGVLRGQAAAFIRAAHQYGLSEIYLVAHACLETGNGTSQLSRGVEVNGTTVYNAFGIGAYDGSALSSGSQRAYQLGWTSVEASIVGGAQWISEHYINSAEARQNTLYKMRWNPENPGYHEYATGIHWAVDQAVNIGKMIKSFGSASETFEVPVYNGMIPPVLSTN